MDDEGNTPLHDAAYGGHLEIVKLLIEKVADIAGKTNGNQTPLHIALQN